MKKQGIYILTNRLNGKQYVGKDSNLPSRINQHLAGKAPDSPAIHNAIKKHGRDAFHIEVVEYPGASHEALNTIETWHITRLGSYENGYNCTKGGEGWDSETARVIVSQRVADGTHNFLDPDWKREHHSNHQRITDGTHHFQDPEWQREHKKNNPFFNPEWQREKALERVEAGTHHLQGYGAAHRKSHWVRHQNFKVKRRELYRIYTALLTSKSIMLEYRHRQLCREGFFDKDIPDTSRSEQQSLFD